MSTLLYVILALVVLGVCIFVHELGHFLAARACGLHVVEFAIGMGPKIFRLAPGRHGLFHPRAAGGRLLRLCGRERGGRGGRPRTTSIYSPRGSASS